MRTLSMALALALAGAHMAQAQDGLAVLKKVQQTYLGLKSYSQKVNSTMASRAMGKTNVQGQTSELRYQPPNRVYIQVSSPQVGSMISYNNAREMLIYRSGINSYQKKPSQPNVMAYVKALREYGIGTMLDPLFFLTGEPIQAQIGSATVKGSDTVDGVPCQVVVGKMAQNLAGKAKSMSAAFWVDKATNLLRKVQIQITGVPGVVRTRVPQNGKSVIKTTQISIDSTITMSVQDIKINPPLDDASFSYAPPKGAVEQNPEKLLKK